MYPWLTSMLNCTKETLLSTIFMVFPSKKRLTKAVPVTIEQIDSIPAVAEGLKVYNNPNAKDEAKHEAMKFISEGVQKFLYAAIYPSSNPSQIGEMIGLPGYAEMTRLVEEKLRRAS